MRKILLVVDFQKDFVDGTLGFEKAVALDIKISQRLKKAKENNETILFTMDTHQSNYLETQEGKNLPVEHCIEESEGWKLYGETGKVIENPIYIKKPTFAARLLEEGVPLEAIKVFLGHKSINMTAYYAQSARVDLTQVLGPIWQIRI